MTLHSVSAANANRNFSAVLRAVRGGRSFVVTSHGRPVARIEPVGRTETTTGAARRALFNRLRGRRITRTAAWTRAELYERSRERRD